MLWVLVGSRLDYFAARGARQKSQTSKEGRRKGRKEGKKEDGRKEGRKKGRKEERKEERKGRRWTDGEAWKKPGGSSAGGSEIEAPD